MKGGSSKASISKTKGKKKGDSTHRRGKERAGCSSSRWPRKRHDSKMRPCPSTEGGGEKKRGPPYLIRRGGIAAFALRRTAARHKSNLGPGSGRKKGDPSRGFER